MKTKNFGTMSATKWVARALGVILFYILQANAQITGSYGASPNEKVSKQWELYCTLSTFRSVC